MVSRKETDASIIVGSILGPVFWGGGNSVQGLMPAGANLVPVVKVPGKIVEFAVGAAGAYTEEFIDNRIVPDNSKAAGD